MVDSVGCGYVVGNRGRGSARPTFGMRSEACGGLRKGRGVGVGKFSCCVECGEMIMNMVELWSCKELY